MSVVVGLPLGILGASKHNTFCDFLSGSLAIVGISTHAYVSASLLVMVFANTFHSVPTAD